MKKPKIVTFSGYARSGKDSSVGILREMLEERGRAVFTVNYADYLKYVSKEYYGWDGIKDEYGRQLLQDVGTEVRKEDQNFWVDTVISLVKLRAHKSDYVLIGDCRYENEITRWDENGYYVYPFRVERLNFDNGLTPEQKAHESEHSLDWHPFLAYLRASDLEQLRFEIKNRVLPVLEGDFL